MKTYFFYIHSEYYSWYLPLNRLSPLLSSFAAYCLQGNSTQQAASRGPLRTARYCQIIVHHGSCGTSNRTRWSVHLQYSAWLHRGACPGNALVFFERCWLSSPYPMRVLGWCPSQSFWEWLLWFYRWVQLVNPEYTPKGCSWQGTDMMLFDWNGGLSFRLDRSLYDSTKRDESVLSSSRGSP